MAVLPEDLLAPEGPVEPSLFPGEHEEGAAALEQRLTAYINKAEAKVASYTFANQADEDEAVAAWSLYLTFRAAYTLALSRPAEDDSRMEVVGRTLFEADQRQGLRDMYEMYLSEYQLAVAGLDDAVSAAASGVSSHQKKIEYDY